MDIKPLQSSDPLNQTGISSVSSGVSLSQDNHQPATSQWDAETKQALDHATGLLQTIVTDKLSDQIIRKMPTDEYLHLLSLLDKIINGSIDKHI